MDGLVNWFERVFGWLPNELFVALVSMVPVIELRGGLPIAYALGMSIWLAVPICIVANMLPVPFILWFVTPLFTALKKTRLFRPLVEKLEARAIGKSEKVEKGWFWGLALFVGVPLPGTGAWTGALIASMLNIPFKKAFPAILLGVIIATIIVGLLVWGLLDPVIALFA